MSYRQGGKGGQKNQAGNAIYFLGQAGFHASVTAIRYRVRRLPGEGPTMGLQYRQLRGCCLSRLLRILLKSGSRCRVRSE